MRISDWSSDVCSSDLTQLSADYDLIILDSTPVFGMSYALILGCLAQKTVLVTRRGWTTQSKAMQAARQLVLCGADMAGAVFNRAHIDRKSTRLNSSH